MTRALIVVDVQNDFTEGGSLPVKGGEALAGRLGNIYAEYDFVVATKDYHSNPGAHFSVTPDYKDSFPPHCVIGTDGADFHPALKLEGIDRIFYKGQDTAAFSGFEGTDLYTDPDTEISLEHYLAANGVDTVDIVGLATDFCVKATALDAVRLGFHTTVRLAFCEAVDPTNESAVNEMAEAGVLLKKD